MLDYHLEPPAPADLALWSLRGLGAIDPAFVAVRAADRLELRRDGQLLASRPSGAPLGRMLSELYGAAWEASPTLRAAGAERLLTSGFDELFNHLDPYSRYLSPDEARRQRERRIGQSGLGLRVAARGENLRVTEITAGGPAARAGIRVGDRLAAVDGQEVDGRDPSRAALLLEGPAGSSVVLRLRRGSQTRETSLRRELLVPQTVRADKRGGILWLTVSGFTVETASRLTRALNDGFATDPPRGVVLDLRGNRGGLLDAAIDLADAFLGSGEVARTEGRHPDAARRYLAGGRDLAQGRPLVVLVDGRTASAAEIAAAALAERGRGVVVGSASTGKGLIQLVSALPHGGELLVSWSRVLAPTGWPVQGLGVLPALCTSLGPEALAEGLAALARGEAPMQAALTRQRAARAPLLASESAALRGTCPPAEGRPADLQAARTLIERHGSYGAALMRPLPQ